MNELIQLYHSTTGRPPKRIEEIAGAVSTRRYFRIYGEKDTIIGTYSPDMRETKAFREFSHHFRKSGINVPEVIAISEDQKFYLQTDLGNQRLHDLIIQREEPGLDDQLLDLYAAAFKELIKIQFTGHWDIDFSVCVPRPAFNSQSVLWDLNHFKYYFLKPSGIPFDEQQLEESFQQFAADFDKLDKEHFMFRDFQSRNIMIHEGEAFLIDFQGGRKGPPQYDLASIVYEARASLTGEDKARLIDLYIEIASTFADLDRTSFIEGFRLAALVRILQALGAYGLRGMVEKKAVFLQSIPAGLGNLEEVLEMLPLDAITSYFRSLLNEVVRTRNTYRTLPEPYDGLTLTIFSFSYRKPLPDDLTGNGGGFVYDCRFLPNPRECEELRMLNGFDPEVKAFLEKEPEAKEFLETIKQQAAAVIHSYRINNYNNLMISFGCTGGRHRSVYISHQFAEWCRKLMGIRVVEIHRELNKEL